MKTFRVVKAEIWKAEYEIQAETLAEAMELVVWENKGKAVGAPEYYGVDGDTRLEVTDLAIGEGIIPFSPEYGALHDGLRERNLLNPNDICEILGVFSATEVKG